MPVTAVKNAYSVDRSSRISASALENLSHMTKGVPDRKSRTAGREGGSRLKAENFLSTYL